MNYDDRGSRHKDRTKKYLKPENVYELVMNNPGFASNIFKKIPIPIGKYTYQCAIPSHADLYTP